MESQTEQPIELALSRSSPPTCRGRQSRARQNIFYILVVGRSGSGKTKFITTACSDLKQSEARFTRRGTIDVESHPLSGVDVEFELVDTPGFDNLNTDLNDVEIFKKIANHLWHPQIIKQGIAGIIYIHPAGDTLYSGALQRNLRVLLDVFLGKSELDRLTILVTQTSTYGVDPRGIVNKMRRQDSMIFNEAHVGGAEIVAIPSNWNRPKCIDILMRYSSRSLISPPIHRPPLRNSLPHLVSYIEDPLGYYKKEPTHIQSHSLSYEKQIESLNSRLEESEATISQYQNLNEQLRTERQVLESTLTKKIQDIQEEYASLRSQVQLQDNSEQEDIVQNLTDLNRAIEDIGSQISAHLVENYVKVTFGKDTTVTSLDARRLSELKWWLGHINGKSSLVASSNGIGLGVEDFFDFSIRHLLCVFLSKLVFQPFHPCIHPSESERMGGIYEEARKQESQYMAGKWRSMTFKSIYKPEHSNSITERVNRVRQLLLSQYLSPLTSYFFGWGQDVGIPLEQQHLDSLHQLIKRAWDWNSKLKGEVVVLGDFTQTVYNPCWDFDPGVMEEFEPDTHRSPAKVILATLGLGLVAWRSVGGGQPPKLTVIRKAIVVTNNFYP